MINKTDYEKYANLLLRFVFQFAIAIIVILLISAGLELWLGFNIYSGFSKFYTSAFGLDVKLAKAIAVPSAAIIILFLPTIIMAVVFRYNRKAVITLTTIIFSIFSILGYYGSENVLFNRITGLGDKYYIKTLEGFKFSSKDDYDSQYGVRYKLITPEISKEIIYWKKFGQHNIIPRVVEGIFFDGFTGEPIVWYALRPDGIQKYSLPGYDKLTGKALLPITTEIVQQQLEIKEEENRKRAEAAKALKDEEEEKKNRIKREAQSKIEQEIEAEKNQAKEKFEAEERFQEKYANERKERQEKIERGELLNEGYVSIKWYNTQIDNMSRLETGVAVVEDYKEHQYFFTDPAFDLVGHYEAYVITAVIKRSCVVMHFQVKSQMNFSSFSHIGGVGSYRNPSFKLYNNKGGEFHPLNIVTPYKGDLSKIKKGQSVDFLAVFHDIDIKVEDFASGQFQLFSAEKNKLNTGSNLANFKALKGHLKAIND